MIFGSITKTLPDGSEAKADYMIDTDKGELVQVGGEAEIVAEDIDLISAMMQSAAEMEDDERAADADE